MNKQLRTAYFAGLIDGEGGIYLEIRQKGHPSVKPTIRVKMTHHQTIVALKEHFGVGVVKPVQTAEMIRRGWQPQWEWRVRHNDARAVARLILPFLITKRDAADRLLAHIPLKRGRKRLTRRAHRD